MGGETVSIKMSKPLITDYEEFASLWNDATTPVTVAQHYGMSAQATFRWASILRGRGYELKAFQKKIDNDAFVQIWKSADSLAEVADRTGLAKASCKVKAYALRATGIELQKFNEPDAETIGLFLRKGVLTESQALENVNGDLAKWKIEPVTRQLWGQSIRPLMEMEGDAESSGGKRGQWFYDESQLWRWSEYIAKRAVLIQLGRWSSKRPYSLDDMDSLVNVGVLDGEIDHPAFTEKQSI